MFIAAVWGKSRVSKVNVLILYLGNVFFTEDATLSSAAAKTGASLLALSTNESASASALGRGSCLWRENLPNVVCHVGRLTNNICALKRRQNSLVDDVMTKAANGENIRRSSLRKRGAEHHTISLIIIIM